MTNWQDIKSAPKDGTAIRFRIMVTQSRGLHQPPYYIFWQNESWHYVNGGRVFPWHEPLQWSADTMDIDESIAFADAYIKCYGSHRLPSGAVTFHP